MADISRTQFNVKIYTNDAANLGWELGRHVSKETALPGATDKSPVQEAGPRLDRDPEAEMSQGIGISLA